MITAIIVCITTNDYISLSEDSCTGSIVNCSPQLWDEYALAFYTSADMYWLYFYSHNIPDASAETFLDVHSKLPCAPAIVYTKVDDWPKGPLVALYPWCRPDSTDWHNHHFFAALLSPDKPHGLFKPRRCDPEDYCVHCEQRIVDDVSPSLPDSTGEYWPLIRQCRIYHSHDMCE